MRIHTSTHLLEKNSIKFAIHTCIICTKNVKTSSVYFYLANFCNHIMRQTLTSQSQILFSKQTLIILSGPPIALKGLKAARGRTVRKMPALLQSLDVTCMELHNKQGRRRKDMFVLKKSQMPFNSIPTRILYDAH